MEPQISSSGFKGMESGSGIITSISSSWSVHQEEEAAAVGLSLELGRGYSGQKLDPKRSFLGFTILQLQELQLQALIFKYIEAGLPVPYHLVLPIWQSFSCSFGNFPTSLGISQMCMDSRKGIEEEPWRCRRTDGKKWRCGKEALPHQKYCERHIHRGRHRSRKLVDSSHYGTTTSPNNNGVNIGGGGGGGGGGTRTPDICINGDVNAGSNLTDLSISLPVNTTSSALFPRFGFSS